MYHVSLMSTRTQGDLGGQGDLSGRLKEKNHGRVEMEVQSLCIQGLLRASFSWNNSSMPLEQSHLRCTLGSVNIFCPKRDFWVRVTAFFFLSLNQEPSREQRPVEEKHKFNCHRKQLGHPFP